MISKGKPLYSILHSKCPRCHEGDIYKVENSYKLKHTLSMHETCSECGHKYMIETGFFYGAMYVNYALTVAISVAFFVATQVLWELSFPLFLLLDAALLLLLSPGLLRLSRNIWMNFFTSYDPDSLNDEDRTF